MSGLQEKFPFLVGVKEFVPSSLAGSKYTSTNQPNQSQGGELKLAPKLGGVDCFVYSCLEPAVHRAHPLPTLDIKGKFTGLPYGAAGKEPAESLHQQDGGEIILTFLLFSTYPCFFLNRATSFFPTYVY